MRSKSPNRLCIVAGDKSAETNEAATKLRSAQKIGSSRKSRLLPLKQIASTSAATPSSMTTRKKMLRGTTYGKKKPEPTISGASSETSNNTIIALRHESSGDMVRDRKSGV